jgi:hypothetical protein
MERYGEVWRRVEIAEGKESPQGDEQQFKFK